jgi:AcrR family transcriptional regulator
MPERREKTDKRLAIVMATLDLIATNGFHGAPTSKIAAKAEVGEGTIYRYFKDKEDLIHQVFQHGADQMSEEILRDHDPKAPIREQYLRLGFNIFNFLVKYPKIYAFNEQYFNSPFGISHKRDILLMERTKKAPGNIPAVHRLLESARDQQIVKDLPLAVLAALTFGPIVFLVRDVSSGLLELEPQTVQRTIEACWDAVTR